MKWKKLTSLMFWHALDWYLYSWRQQKGVHMVQHHRSVHQWTWPEYQDLLAAWVWGHFCDMEHYREALVLSASIPASLHQVSAPSARRKFPLRRCCCWLAAEKNIYGRRCPNTQSSRFVDWFATGSPNWWNDGGTTSFYGSHSCPTKFHRCWGPPSCLSPAPKILEQTAISRWDFASS